MLNFRFDSHDLKIVRDLGNAFWSNPEEKQVTSETVAAASMLCLSKERLIEKIIQSLLSRAENSQFSELSLKIQHPFFQLSCPNRFLLIAIHRWNWSYARVANVLRLPIEQIQPLVWNARLGVSGGSHYSGIIPNHLKEDPFWMQQLIDQDGSYRKRFSHQIHLQSCVECQNTFNRYRKFYFSIEKTLFDLFKNPDQIEVQDLETVFYKSPNQKRLLTFGETLLIFFQKPENIFGFLLLFGLIFFRFKSLK